MLDRPMRIALAVGMPLVVVLYVVSSLWDWGVGGFYAGFAVISVIVLLILERGLPRRPRGN